MAQAPLIEQFVIDINAVVDKYRGQGLTMGECIGGLESVKLAVWHEHAVESKDDDETESEVIPNGNDD